MPHFDATAHILVRRDALIDPFTAVNIANNRRLRHYQTLLGADKNKRNANFLTWPERTSTRKSIIKVNR